MTHDNPGLVYKIYETIESLALLSATEEVIEVMRRAVASFGIRYLCFNTFPQVDQCFEDVTLAISVPEEWRRIYSQRQYVDVDPTIQQCKTTNVPFNWKDAAYRVKGGSRVEEFLNLAADFGLANGFWFPVSGRRGSIGGIWLGGDSAEFSAGEISIIHLLALCAFDRLARSRTTRRDSLVPLTGRERDVLAWAAQGKSAWETGEILGIAKRTVDEHAQTACRKLNAVNRTQAVALALGARIIAL